MNVRRSFAIGMLLTASSETRVTVYICLVDGKQIRLAARRGAWSGTTRGAAPGYVQCNVTIVPADVAEGFAAWSDANPGVAPVLARGRAGHPALPSLGADLDVRTDVPGYMVMRA